VSRRRLGGAATAAVLALGATVASGAVDPGGGSEVSAEVAELLRTSAQPPVLSLAVDQGGSSSPENLRLDVLSNLADGYAVTVRRTALSRGDLTVRMTGVRPSDAELVLAFPTDWTALPAGTERAFGRRRPGTISDAAGDRWRARLVVGPIGCAPTGLHSGVLAFTTRAGAGTDIARVALEVNVQRNRRLCG
jgi:hypothetical protein